jgi:hypothetical protein
MFRLNHDMIGPDICPHRDALTVTENMEGGMGETLTEIGNNGKII